ncbi:MAG: hypothetical protein ABJE47_19420 [bacterium]
MRRLACLLVLAIAATPPAGAQDSTAVETSPRISPAFGVHYGTPLRFSAALGMLVDMGPRRNDGLVVMVEPGQHGNEVSAGYFRLLGHFGSGYSLRAAVLRTGDEPWNSSPRTTYVGVEAHWMIVFGVGGRLGYLRRASRTGSDPHDNLATVGVSIGG